MNMELKQKVKSLFNSEKEYIQFIVSENGRIQADKSHKASMKKCGGMAGYRKEMQRRGRLAQIKRVKGR